MILLQGHAVTLTLEVSTLILFAICHIYMVIISVQ